MSNDPKTGGWETRHKTVQRPETEPRYSVESRMREVDVFWGDIRIKGTKTNYERSNDDEIHDDVHRRVQRTALETMRPAHRHELDALKGSEKKRRPTESHLRDP